MTRPARILLVAAESSGDRLGADLVRALKAACGGRELEFYGTGGSAMAAEGFVSTFDIADLSVLGLFEAVSAYPRVVRRADDVADLAEQVRPDVAVLIDSWGFTLRVAQRLKKRLPELPVVKYVGPQVWATRAGRAKTLAETVDRLLTIHSFDAPMFEAHGLKTTFVGNPALEREWNGDGDGFRARHGITPGATVLSVLFGSRPAELKGVYEPFVQAVEILRRDNPDLAVITPLAGPIDAAARERLSADPRMKGVVVVSEDEKADAFAATDLALACSGTVTTELATLGVPAVIGYRLGWMTWFLLRAFLLRAKYISLVNLAADEELFAERVQTQTTGPKLARECQSWLDDPARRAEVSRKLIATTEVMRGNGKAAHRAASVVCEYLPD